MTASPRPGGRFGDLGIRALSGIGLAALVSIDLWLGGVWVTALAALAAVLMLWELHRMASGNGSFAAPGLLAAVAPTVAGVVAAAMIGIYTGLALVAVGAVAVLLAGRDRVRARWMAAGVLYVGSAMAYVGEMRDDAGLGLAAIVWLIVVIAAADIAAYFTGRTIGGPKLWPAVSPKKTWAGSLGGLLGGAIVGIVTATVTGWSIPIVAALSVGVVIASQAGDLLESSVKRHFGVKDASNLIPGHGGVLDRLDGVIGGLWFFALYDMAGGSLGG